MDGVATARLTAGILVKDAHHRQCLSQNRSALLLMVVRKVRVSALSTRRCSTVLARGCLNPGVNSGLKISTLKALAQMRGNQHLLPTLSS
jgi:hypothetical protein